MFDWIGKIVEAISNSIGNMVSFLGTQLANAIFDAILKWFYEMIYNAVADFFTEMGKMGAEMFDLSWVQATVTLFTYFGWALFAAGTVVAIFDVAVEYQSGRANIKTASINVIKGFFACSLIGIVPIELYKFCIALQNTFAHGLTGLMVSGKTVDLSGESTSVLEGCFKVSAQTTFNLFNILCLIAFAYCVVKIFFQNIKRGGFVQWMKQVAAICLTAFLQTTILYLGLLTFPDNMLLGMGILLSANEVPRIAQQFGLDSSVKVNMMSVVHATTTAVNLTRTVARSVK